MADQTVEGSISMSAPQANPHLIEVSVLTDCQSADCDPLRRFDQVAVGMTLGRGRQGEFRQTEGVPSHRTSDIEQKSVSSQTRLTGHFDAATS